MPTSTYVALATTTLTSSASSVTFSSIPQDYRDLVLVFNGGSSSGQAQAGVRLNSDSGNNYSSVVMAGNGSGTFTSSQTAAQLAMTWAYAYTAPTNNTSVMQIMDYSATDKHKSALTRTPIPDAATLAHASRWANNAAVNSVSVVAFIGSFSAGSTISLYGIEA